MAYISKECVVCTDPTKKESGAYHGRDEKGKYSGPLYVCKNVCCKFYYSRMKPRVQSSADEPKGVAQRDK